MLRSSGRALAVLAVAFLPISAAAQTPRSVRLEPYVFRTFDGAEHPAELGHLTVPERRGARGAKPIEVAFVRLKTTAEKPGAPVIFLAGGPGAPGVGMARVPVYFSLFQRLRAHGDVILVDQRGTGLSRPSLDCPPDSVSNDVFTTARSWAREFDRITRRCIARFQAQGRDLAGYTTEESADDVDDLRAALGYQRVSLVGHSYGTVLAQAILRRHPRSVERAVLAAVDGPDHLVVLPGVWDANLRKLGELAARDTSLRHAVPDLDGLLRRVLREMDARPLAITVRDERAGRPVTLRVGSIGLRWLLRIQASDARTYADLPALLLALDRGDHAGLARRLEPLYNGFRRSAMAMAVDCAFGWSPARMERARAEAAGAVFDNVNLQWSTGICAIPGLPRRSRESDTPVFSTIPTLFISGTLDPITPPFQAEEVRWGFPNAAHLVVENGGHETLPSAAVQRIVADFLSGADVSDRRVSFAPPRFTTTLAGPSAVAERR